jgi:hypothetical protein
MMSRFRIWLLFLLMVTMPFFLVTIVLLWTVFYYLLRQKNISKDMVMGFIPILLMVFLVIIIREIRFKWNRIEIRDNLLLVKRFFGMGRVDKFPLDQLDGFTKSYEPSRVTLGMTLNLYYKNNRVVEISDTPYNNFIQLYRQIGKRVKDLGDENYGFGRTIKNAFGKPITIQNSR